MHQQLLVLSLPQVCNCSTVGSLAAQCNANTGQCSCHPKFSGMKCSECSRGHWNYPLCSLCDCFLPGTDAATCDSETGKCSCSDQTGQCTCKVRVTERLQGKSRFPGHPVTQLYFHSLFSILAPFSNADKCSRPGFLDGWCSLAFRGPLSRTTFNPSVTLFPVST